MISNVKTPGVYVDEFSLLPPSVAQVETAIPAFIGYTEKAVSDKGEDLLYQPTRVKSMLEYENWFGQAKVQDLVVNLDAVEPYAVQSVDFLSSESPYRMSQAIEMYFANGGGPCFIVSVGDYDSSSSVPSLDTIDDFDELNAGLRAIRKIDEVTLLVVPEADRLNSSQMYDLYKEALGQCQDLKDRFCLFDVLADDGDGSDFRNNIGTNNLMYGAAYYPYLNTGLIQPNDSSQVTFIHPTKPFHNSSMEALDTLSNVINHVDEVAKSKTIADKAVVDAAGQEKKSMITHFKAAMSAAEKAKSHAAAAKDLVEDEAFDIADFTQADAVLQGVKDDKVDINDTTTEIEEALDSLAESCSDFDGFGAAVLAKINEETDIDASKNDDVRTFYTNQFVASVRLALNDFKVTMPPAAAVAGIYARVDSNRGVWKSPANESINLVTGPAVKVDNLDNDNFNVHSTGKSINVIRAFTGKGTLVWGARTLDGNSGEWKYVSVRRFFNMVEESVKKASEQFVFEPNDANTWVRVKAMIENFLVLQWRAGALMGGKPEEAFFVHVGLGETMTADDVLNGKMIIEIGLAAVRPAEFIILRFSHKMMEA